MVNFEVKLFDYTDKVRAQIGTQQTALMAVATARAKAQQAEQEALMAEAEGKANVARAKYEEEEKKIRAVVAGQQRLEVADLDRQAAAEKKQEQILLGQGEAERKRLVLKADGALKQKLEAYVQAQKLWANAFAQRQVPSLVMGGGGAGDTDKSTTKLRPDDAAPGRQTNGAGPFNAQGRDQQATIASAHFSPAAVREWKQKRASVVPLARFSHHLTVEARNKPAMTALRLLAFRYSWLAISSSGTLLNTPRGRMRFRVSSRNQRSTEIEPRRRRGNAVKQSPRRFEM